MFAIGGANYTRHLISMLPGEPKDGHETTRNEEVRYDD
jgi:hypothetical protein